jgi:hypothetical protein
LQKEKTLSKTKKMFSKFFNLVPLRRQRRVQIADLESDRADTANRAARLAVSDVLRAANAHAAKMVPMATVTNARDSGFYRASDPAHVLNDGKGFFLSDN